MCIYLFNFKLFYNGSNWIVTVTMSHKIGNRSQSTTNRNSCHYKYLHLPQRYLPNHDIIFFTSKLGQSTDWKSQGRFSDLNVKDYQKQIWNVLHRSFTKVYPTKVNSQFTKISINRLNIIIGLFNFSFFFSNFSLWLRFFGNTFPHKRHKYVYIFC